MNNPIFILSLDSIYRLLIQLLFFEKVNFPQVDLRILFLFLFSKSRVQVRSQVQTQTNCYMYPILLPVVSVTDLNS